MLDSEFYDLPILVKDIHNLSWFTDWMKKDKNNLQFNLAKIDFLMQININNQPKNINWF